MPAHEHRKPWLTITPDWPFDFKDRAFRLCRKYELPEADFDILYQFMRQSETGWAGKKPIEVLYSPALLRHNFPERGWPEIRSSVARLGKAGLILRVPPNGIDVSPVRDRRL